LPGNEQQQHFATSVADHRFLVLIAVTSWHFGSWTSIARLGRSADAGLVPHQGKRMEKA